jgi:peptidoglycan hydrolase-like protein with peptidoglycan-binding domain
MHDASGKWVGWGLGDVDPKVAQIQDFLKRRYSARTKSLVVTGVYDQATADVVAGLQDYYKVQVPAGLRGVFTYATQLATSFVKPTPKPRVPFFTVEGHMSDMMLGPVAGTAEALEQEGRVTHFPTGYNNGAIPFDNKSGSDELSRRVQTFAPLGTKKVIAGFSQGAMVVTDYLVNEVIGTPLEDDILGVLYYGNPTRSKGSVAPWSRAQAGPAQNAGMDPKVRFDLLGLEPKFPVMDVYRKGDMFSDNPPTEQGALESACYEAIARSDFFGNQFSIAAQIAKAFVVPVDFVIGVFEAIFSSLGFLANPNNPHYSPFEISGGINWVRSLLP